VGALRFFYIKTLKKSWNVEETPYPKKRLHLPVILSQDEVSRLIESALTPFHRTILITLYATGVRRAELANLKVGDIDSQRMVVHVRGGKPDSSAWASVGLLRPRIDIDLPAPRPHLACRRTVRLALCNLLQSREGADKPAYRTLARKARYLTVSNSSESETPNARASR
jgi:hypothetical protein